MIMINLEGINLYSLSCGFAAQTSDSCQSGLACRKPWAGAEKRKMQCLFPRASCISKFCQHTGSHKNWDMLNVTHARL